MFSALNEKVERLEKENEDLKARLADFTQRFADLENKLANQSDSKKVGSDGFALVCRNESGIPFFYTKVQHLMKLHNA